MPHACCIDLGRFLNPRFSCSRDGLRVHELRSPQPVKIPPNRRKTARASLRRIAKKLGIRFQVGRSVRTSLSERDPSDQTSE